MASVLDAERTASHQHRTLETVVNSRVGRGALIGMRLYIGWCFLWPFIDKMFGFGFATKPGNGVIDGGLPAKGFLTHAKGIFAPLFTALANLSPFVDILFMLGLLGIGAAVLFGVGLKPAAWCGAVLLALMYLAEFPLGAEAGTYTNPLFDDHWLLALGLFAVAYTYAGDKFGFGRWWARRVGEDSPWR